jgi:uncharacterized protein YndB with AHSA1/START domain
MNYCRDILFNSSPETLFTAITQNLSDWWGKNNTEVSKEGDEFKITFGNAFWKFRIIEFNTNQKVVWECIDGQPEFEREWVGTKLFWIIEQVDDQVKLSFTHHGLTPGFECYDVCASTWEMFLTTSLKSYVETGKGMPHN